MAKFPHPPPVSDLVGLGVRDDERRLLSVGTTLWRLYFQGGPHPTAWHDFRDFGPTASRFDHHEPPARPQARAILYAAELGPACLAEVYQDTRAIDRRRRSPWLVAFELTHPLMTLDLGGSWPTRAGASQATNSGPRPRARAWSRAIVEAFPDLDGLCYPSSMYKGAPAFALYERAIDALPLRPTFNRPLADAALQAALAEVAREVGYALV